MVKQLLQTISGHVGKDDGGFPGKKCPIWVVSEDCDVSGVTIGSSMRSLNILGYHCLPGHAGAMKMTQCVSFAFLSTQSGIDKGGKE